MKLYTEDLNEIKNTQYDKSMVREIVKKIQHGVLRTDLETEFLIKSGISLVLKDMSCENLEVEIIDDPSSTIMGYALDSDKNGVDLVNLNVTNYLKNGNLYKFFLGIKTIGHEFEHIKQSKRCYNVGINIDKILIFIETLSTSYNFTKYLDEHDNYYFEKKADEAGVGFIKNYCGYYLNKDMNLDDLDPVSLMKAEKESKINKVVGRVDFFKRCLESLSALENMDFSKYNYYLKRYRLEKIFPNVPGTLYNPEYYLNLYNSTNNFEEKIALNFMYRVACFYRLNKNTKMIISKVKSAISSIGNKPVAITDSSKNMVNPLITKR